RVGVDEEADIHQPVGGIAQRLVARDVQNPMVQPLVEIGQDLDRVLLPCPGLHFVADRRERTNVRIVAQSGGKAGAAALEQRADRIALAHLADRPAPDHRPGMRHHLILDISGNQTLRDTADRLMDIGFLIHTYTKFQPRDLGRSFADHRDLVSAIASRDAEWAASVMRAHILAARNTLLQTMTDLRDGGDHDRDDIAL
ncbi:MAG TPA: FCD domain-containing protein, partial [Aurantimonas coralicida]|nr:FCD domain-containing protein [Aurantimonas coralicida]